MGMLMIKTIIKTSSDTLHCISKMMKYFFAVGHVNYARFGIAYILNMSRLPSELRQSFFNEEYVMRQIDGHLNSIRPDMMIETIFICQGKGTLRDRSLVELSMNPEQT